MPAYFFARSLPTGSCPLKASQLRSVEKSMRGSKEAGPSPSWGLWDSHTLGNMSQPAKAPGWYPGGRKKALPSCPLPAKALEGLPLNLVFLQGRSREQRFLFTISCLDVPFLNS